MSIWLKSLLTGLVITALVIFVYKKMTSQKVKQLFSIHYIVEVNPDKEFTGNSKKDVINNVPYIIKRRADASGYIATIKIIGDKMLDINFHDIDDTIRALQIITNNSKLEFREIYTLNEIPLFLTKGDEIARKYFPPQHVKKPTPKKSDDTTISREVRELLRNMEKSKEDAEMIASGIGSLISFSNVSEQISVNANSSSDIGLINETDTASLNKILSSRELLEVLPHDIKFYYGHANDLSKRKGANIFYLYAIRTGGYENSKLQNRDIESAFMGFDQSARPEIAFRFSPSGARKWEQMTRKNTGRFIAIIIDHLVISAPLVNGPITDGSSIISGGFTVKEANILATQLSSGNIPAKLIIVKQEILSKSLGSMRKLLFLTLTVFVATIGLAYLIFNILKNK